MFSIAIFIISCGDNATKPGNLDEINLNIINFSPNSFFVKPATSYIIAINGVNFLESEN